MATRTSALTVGLIVAGNLSLASSARAVNVLVDGGFEAPISTTLGNVITNFTGFPNLWGPEAATNTGASDGVTPLAGAMMHRMVSDNITTTQTIQVNDVTSFAAIIDAGNAIVTSSAMYNAGQGVPAAVCSISVSFHNSTATFGGQTGPFIAQGLTLDASTNTWQNATTSGAIPVGTRWLLTQVAYNNASLVTTAGVDGAGMVDAAFTDVRIVPEPASLAAVASLSLLASRRRRA